ncbi:COX15/CtaA family protein [Sneathiella aquimaris]|uniref:COX15/CtaA family protein n=1 Tax=Sneathiella aquimaris TaxID=2599305 RepID=UPI001CA5E11A|nr:COX15/CtaA family protein [Sneathiella aquimaris]
MMILSSMPVSENHRNNQLLAYWLIGVAFLVFAMVVLGGVTRLTESGLSMVDWRPVTGWLPPFGEAAWLAEFDKYKAFPEYQKVNKGMSLEEFKGIFAFEYAHRLLGRIIGLAFFVPFVVFLLFGKIQLNQIPRLLFLFVLGGLQGVMGWVMVKSGLVDHPDVSHYRLTAHLGLASLIFAALLWTIMDVLHPTLPGESRPANVLKWARIFLGLVFLQILIGGFVAGLNAGFIYNEWPQMGEGFYPDDLFALSPLYLNFFENVATIQFMHRLVAYVIVIAFLVLLVVGRRPGIGDRARSLIMLLFVSVFAQVGLGIWTLLAVVPVTLGALHQAGGMIVLGFAVCLVHELTARRI